MALETWVKRAVLGVIVFTLLEIIFFHRVWIWKNPIDGRRPFPLKFDFDLKEVVPAAIGVASVEPIGPSFKPWPAIPSFKPWTRDPNLKPYTCEAYFGNGFSEEHRVLSSNSSLSRVDNATDGSFRCLYSETLRASICEGKQLVMNLDKITVSRGGEDIDEVIGRDEEAELPVFSNGAFQVQIPGGGGGQQQALQPGAPVFAEAKVSKLMPRGQIRMHTMRSLLLNLQAVDSSSVVCSTRVRQPTVILTRFEYANLFHTVTDWYSAYISSRIAGLDYRPHLVLLDGHCESPMDDAWEAMFSSVTYAMHFNGPVCFDHAIFAPLGYDIPLFKHIGTTLECSGCSVEELDSTAVGPGKDRRTARLREFGEFFGASFDAKNRSVIAEADGQQIQEVNVLFVRREDYLAHPRHNGRPESRLSNEEEVYSELKKWAAEKSTKVLNVTVVNGLLAHMTLDEQIQTVKKADILVGAHGAGLTHLVFAKPTTVVLELSSPSYRRPHFATLSFWTGMDYRIIEMESSFANTNQVIRKMTEILKDVKALKSN